MNDDSENDEYCELEDEAADDPFSKSFGPEMMDSRLNDGEKILLFWLRFRCWANKRNGQRGFFKYSEIAKDLGVCYKTITNRTAVLENLGFLGTTYNGYGRTKIKVIRDPKKIYGAHRVQAAFEYLKKDRTAEDIAFIRSIGLQPDESLIPGKIRVTRRNISVSPIQEQNCSSDDRDQNNGADITGKMVPISTGKMVPISTGKMVPIISRSISEIDQMEVDQSKRDQPSPGTPSSLIPGEKIRNVDDRFDLSDSEDPDQLNNGSLVDDDGVARVKSTQAAMEAALDKQGSLAEKRLDKQRRISDEQRARAEEKKKELRKQQAMESPQKWTWAKLEKQIWAKLFQDFYPGFTRSSWRKHPEGEVAEKLLKDYGIDVLQVGFVTFFEQWGFLKKKTFPYSKDPEKWLVPDFAFFGRPEGQQFLAAIKIEKPKIVNRTQSILPPDSKKTGMW